LCITVRRRAITLTYCFEAAGSRRLGGIMVSGVACVVCCVVHRFFFVYAGCVLHVLFGVVYEVTLVKNFE
jgi:hypothetical protein